MTTEEFVQGFYREKQALLAFYLQRLAPLAEGAESQGIQLRDGQQLPVQELLDNVLTNTFYSLLLGLEGSASIGGTQTRYEVRDPMGSLLTDGDLGGYAWQYFQNDGEEDT
jgi:hypothetical protein